MDELLNSKQYLPLKFKYLSTDSQLGNFGMDSILNDPPTQAQK
jgi:hypothetical protein